MRGRSPLHDLAVGVSLVSLILLAWSALSTSPLSLPYHETSTTNRHPLRHCKKNRTNFSRPNDMTNTPSFFQIFLETFTPLRSAHETSFLENLNLHENEACVSLTPRSASIALGWFGAWQFFNDMTLDKLVCLWARLLFNVHTCGMCMTLQ